VADRLVYVEWVDSFTPTSTAWRDRHDTAADADATFVCKSVGWVVGESDANLVLVAHVAQQEVCGQMTIPKCAIRKRKVIRL
jgi:hypothetical protein